MRNHLTLMVIKQSLRASRHEVRPRAWTPRFDALDRIGSTERKRAP